VSPRGALIGWFVASALASAVVSAGVLTLIHSGAEATTLPAVEQSIWSASTLAPSPEHRRPRVTGETPTPTPPIVRTPTPTPAPDDAVLLSPISGFILEDLDIPPGTIVRWRNDDTALHSATDQGGQWDSGLLSLGQTWEYEFTRPGRFRYYCFLHPNMVATITVR
jgi:hypothetical protein